MKNCRNPLPGTEGVSFSSHFIQTQLNKGGAFQGGAGEGPPKVLGHGHGRARRLSLRQNSLAKNDIEKAVIDSCEDSVTMALGTEAYGDSQGANGRMNGKHHHEDGSVPIVSTNGGNRIGGIAPNLSHARQRRVLSSSERRKRAESMGNWAMLGFGGYGNGYIGDCSAHEVGAREYSEDDADMVPQATNVSHVTDLVQGDGADVGRASERGLLSRALSASGREESDGKSDEDELVSEKLPATTVTAATPMVTSSSSLGDEEQVRFALNKPFAILFEFCTGFRMS